MAFKKKDLESQALDAIKKHRLFTIKDVVAYLPCSLQTFYNQKLDELESIKDAINTNKVRTKQEMRQKWFKSDNATLQIGLYKLLADDDERQALTQQNVDHTSKGEKIAQPQVYLPADMTPDETGIPADPPPVPPVAPA